MDLESTFCEKYIELLRYDKLYNSYPFFLVIIIHILAVGHSLAAAYVEHGNVEILVNAACDGSIIALLACHAIQRNMSKDSLRLIELIKDEYVVDRRDFEGRQEKLIKLETFHEEKRKYYRKIMKLFPVILIASFVLMLSRNGLNYFVMILVGNAEYKSTGWPTAYLSYHPLEFNSLIFFLFLYTLYAITLFTFIADTCVLLALVFLSTEKVLADFETIYMFLADLGKDFPDAELHDNILSTQSNNQLVTWTDQAASLRKDMARILQRHQNLIRNFNILVDCSEYGHSAFISTNIFYNCTVVYFMLMSNNLLKRAIFAICYILTNSCIFIFFYNGQRIFNQNDMLRKNLAEVPWTDKPLWFKKALLMMMTRAHIDLQLKPFGIYILNCMSFKDLIKTTFAIANIFYTKKLSSQGGLQQ